MSAQNKTPHSVPSESGIILLAHGSRQPAWREPFDLILTQIASQSKGPAILAFGEFMQPDLSQAVKTLALSGVKRAVIVPLFLGGGIHVRSDLPALAQKAREESGMELTVAEAIGQVPEVLQAIAAYSLRLSESF
ncbi:MAG: CbiX/SirB N-terminal domain-containing protein [Betaproteobacteria bacterium]|jgi:sirohydrochlorin cobaltochelatase